MARGYPIVSSAGLIRSWVLVLLLAFFLTGTSASDVDNGRYGNQPKTHYYDWKVVYTQVTRLCSVKQIVSINGQFPGPTVYVREGDSLVIKVSNHVQDNVTLHWHGLKQRLQNWQDGPAYVTQCPIQTGDSFTYRFKVDNGQRGTVWWHAHISWLRVTLHGAFIVLPKRGVSYPFPKPQAEHTLIFGQWWNNDTEQIEANAVRLSDPRHVESDALTINGQPGDLYNCSAKEMTRLKVEAGNTYLLRIINAALNFDLFFSIAGHNLTVVEADAAYTKPYTSSVIVVTPGQTTNVLVTANKKKGGEFYMAVSVFSPFPEALEPFPTVPGTAILEYIKPRAEPGKTRRSKVPRFPVHDDVAAASAYDSNIKSLATKEYPIQVPKNLDQELLFTVSFNFDPCAPGVPCFLIDGKFRTLTSINNISFVDPHVSLLEAYYYHQKNVYSTDFPATPKQPFNYTEPVDPSSWPTLIPEQATKLHVLKYGANVQLVLQNTNVGYDTHPFHLHGYSFFVVGSGLGNFNATHDSRNFNLEDPPLLNTASVPAAGWVALRFKADNPGVWLLHCHFEIHVSWGMSMAFLVENGKGPRQTLPPPPPFMPKC